MTDICSECGEILGCYCWKESIRELPPLGEVIEGSNPKDWIYSILGRDYFVLVQINDDLVWITHSGIDDNYNKLKITHWRHLPPDPKGRKAFVKIKKDKRGYLEAKLSLVKVENL